MTDRQTEKKNEIQKNPSTIPQFLSYVTIVLDGTEWELACHRKRQKVLPVAHLTGIFWIRNAISHLRLIVTIFLSCVVSVTAYMRVTHRRTDYANLYYSWSKLWRPANSKTPGPGTQAAAVSYRNMPSIWGPFSRRTSSESAVSIHGNCRPGNRSACICMTSLSVAPNMDGWNMECCNDNRLPFTCMQSKLLPAATVTLILYTWPWNCLLSNKNQW